MAQTTHSLQAHSVLDVFSAVMKKAEVNEDFSLIYLFNKLLAVADVYAFPQL